MHKLRRLGDEHQAACLVSLTNKPYYLYSIVISIYKYTTFVLSLSILPNHYFCTLFPFPKPIVL